MDFSCVDQEAFDPGLSLEELAAQVTAAAEVGVGGICVEPYFVAHVAQVLRGTRTQTVAVLRTRAMAKSIIKAIETSSAVKDGADRVEVAINWSMLAQNDFASIRAELLEITRAARAARNDVILSAYCIHLPERVEELADAVRQGAFDEMVLHPPGEDQFESVSQAMQGLRLKYSSMIESPDDLLAVGADRAGVPMIDTE